MMDSTIKLNKNKLLIFHESRKRRQLVGELIYLKKQDQYELLYDKKYTQSKHAIPLAKDLSLFKICHKSEKGKLFSVFLDRIPEKANPAYEDYCKAQGISPKEKNLILLLGFIGKRGPSSFVFEPIYETDFSPQEILKFRRELKISQQEFADVFGIKKLTLLKIETGKSKDATTLKLIQLFLNFPEVALWQLKQSGAYIHHTAQTKLEIYFLTKLAQKTKA